MIPNDFIYKEIYQGALKAGAKKSVAKAQAEQGEEDYRKGRYENISRLLDDRIKAAKKIK